MPVTININNLTLCHKGSNGITTATIPDVCKTPSPGGPVPIPYPNIAMSSDLMKGTTTVKADGGMMCANYGSEFFKSTGDEPGVAGGVVSNVFIKEATWITFSFDVKLQGKAACRLTDKMFHNHMNTVNAGGLFQAFLAPNGPLTAIDEVKSLGSMAGKSNADIAAQMKAAGYSPITGNNGGTIWTKSLPDGNTSVVRVDPAMVRVKPKGFADEVPHVHKEIVPTNKVTNGNYKPADAIKLDDHGLPSTDPGKTHIPGGH